MASKRTSKGLKSNKQFGLVYREGERVVGRKVTICYMKHGSEGVIPGFVASKKNVGSAYQRNRAKRLMRETFGGICDRIKEENLWIVFIASFNPKETSFHELAEDVECSLGRAGLISTCG